MKSYQQLFSSALGHIPARLHAAAHSHHLRPDVVRDAQHACLEDAFQLADGKWQRFFEVVYPSAQAHVARLLGTGRPENVVFGSSSHELLLRVLSCFSAPVRILTSDSEFHSASRQFRRLEEAGLALMTRIPAEPFASFPERFAGAARSTHDLVFLSHVFFNSGYVVPDLEVIVAAVADPATFVVVDGYHAFLALPVDLRRLHTRIFYLAGGYKYAMSGEGACFLHAPDGYGPRPVNTGWFAGFGALEGEAVERVPYASDASRFAGATLAPDGIYRFAAVMALLARQGVDASVVHERVQALQELFLERLTTPALPRDQLLLPGARGNFLTWRTPAAALLQQRLSALGVVSDHRDDRLRLGFGLYHDPVDIEAMAEIVNRL
jgi:selenocysteine lyase/cysteine desulfurase